MPAVLGLGWWKILMSWPPVEILFQPRLPVGNVCVFANTRSYSIPSAGLFWLLTKRCQLQPGACERGGEQHGGRWHNRRAAGPASSAEPWEAGGTYVTSSGAVVCGLWSPAHTERGRSVYWDLCFAAGRRGLPPVHSPGSIRWVCQAASANQPLAGTAQEGTSLGLLYYHRLNAVADDCDNSRRIAVIKETIFTKLLEVLFSIYIINAISKY